MIIELSYYRTIMQRKFHTRHHRHGRIANQLDVQHEAARRRAINHLNRNEPDDLTGMIPFELHPWHIILCVSFFLGMVIAVVFFGVLQNDFHDFQGQMTIMHEDHEKEMELMQKQYEKQIRIMHERQLIIQKQTDLINAFTQIMHEIQRSMEEYVAGIREYSYLKDIDNSWLSSLSREERARMYWLEEFLGTDEVIDVRMTIAIVKQNFKRTERDFSSGLAELEDALDRMDIDKMKQLQKQINKKHLTAYLQGTTEQIKLGISASRALQKPGALSRIASRFYQSLVAVIYKILE